VSLTAAGGLDAFLCPAVEEGRIYKRNAGDNIKMASKVGEEE